MRSNLKNKILNKINIFYSESLKEEINCQTSSITPASTSIKNDFEESLKCDKNGKIKLSNIQRKFDNGYISEEELSNKEIEEMINLYKKQISELSIANIKHKKRLVEFRNNIYNKV